MNITQHFVDFLYYIPGNSKKKSIFIISPEYLNAMIQVWPNMTHAILIDFKP